jgi:hypothetical protein
MFLPLPLTSDMLVPMAEAHYDVARRTGQGISRRQLSPDQFGPRLDYYGRGRSGLGLSPGEFSASWSLARAHAQEAARRSAVITGVLGGPKWVRQAHAEALQGLRRMHAARAAMYR